MTLNMDQLPKLPSPQHGIYCNRTLNLRTIRAIGYDMDYTLIHYNVYEWEKRAYKYLKLKLEEQGIPVDGLEFDPNLTMQGLLIDLELGNLIKANRFGFIVHAFHGTKALDFETQRKNYARVLVDLSDDRYVFLNTLFSLSESCMYTQLVDRLDDRQLPEGMGYSDLYRLVRENINYAHMEGQLKQEILNDPDTFVMLDEGTPKALMDQKLAGKKLLLITNSEWEYTHPMMTYTFDRFLPENTTWRDLFDLVIVSARKPNFFSDSLPVYEIVEENGLLKPVFGELKQAGVYHGGCASLIESHFNLTGAEFLYVGDHIFSDVHVSKKVLRWRTGLVVRELEDELIALENFHEKQVKLSNLMEEKSELERKYNLVRLELLRLQKGGQTESDASEEELLLLRDQLRAEFEALDAFIAPLAIESNSLMNENWGLLMRAGKDKSQFARQVEHHSDIYMSRVSNFLEHTPFAMMRSPRSSLPHDLTTYPDSINR